MTTRQIRDRLGSILNPPEVTTPAEELAEDREVAPGAEVSGHLLRHHLEIPESMGPDWSPLIAEMRDELAGGVAEVIADLLALHRPEALVGFHQEPADAAGNVLVALPVVPPGLSWEIANLHVRHSEGAAQDFSIHLEPGGQIDGLSVAATVGTSPRWSAPLIIREGVRVTAAHTAGGLTGRVDVAIFGRIHSTRREG